MPEHGGNTNVKSSAYDAIKAEFDEYGYVVLNDLLWREDAARVAPMYY